MGLALVWWRFGFYCSIVSIDFICGLIKDRDWQEMAFVIFP